MSETGANVARIRSTKPEFWSDRKLARQLSRDARLLYMALWNFADEHARVLGDPRWIKGACFAYEDDLEIDDIERLLGEMFDADKVRAYIVDGDPYLFLPNLAKHQRLEKDKVPSRLPDPPDQVINPDTPPSAPRANLPARDSDGPEPGPDELSLLYVAGGREQVAGSREQGSMVLSVGELTDRNARVGEAPAAQPEQPSIPREHEFQARKLIHDIPRYRDAQPWYRRHLAQLVGAALAAGFGVDAIAGYAVMVITEGRFQARQHIPELRDALRRLNRDAVQGSACRGCGFDPADCGCRAEADPPWTLDDQAAFERALDHLQPTPDDLRQALP